LPYHLIIEILATFNPKNAYLCREGDFGWRTIAERGLVAVTEEFPGFSRIPGFGGG
jgi:hypothetical protein